MTRKTIQEREAEIRNRPVSYHENGVPKSPVTYSQLFNEVIRLKAAYKSSEVHSGEWIDKLNENIKRLKILVRDAYIEGLDAGHNTRIDVSSENLWADSEARAELCDD